LVRLVRAPFTKEIHCRIPRSSGGPSG
jgi:hypothetical protein